MKTTETRHPISDCERYLREAISASLARAVDGSADVEGIMLDDTCREVLLHAVDVVLHYVDARFDGVYYDVSVDGLITVARDRCSLSVEAYEAIPEAKRTAVRFIVDDLAYDHLPHRDHGDDVDDITVTAENLGAVLADMDGDGDRYRRATRLRLTAFSRLTDDDQYLLIGHSEVLMRVAFEILEKHDDGVPLDNNPFTVNGIVLRACDDSTDLGAAERNAIKNAVCAMIDEMYPPEPDGPDALEDGIAESVTAVLRQYRHNARALGGAAADEWAKTQIAEEASRLVPDADGERNPRWHRVHDEIRRLFHRYMIHLDDGEPMPDGEYEVRIRGWNSWVPARLERDGWTWKLPIGRVSADGIDSTVAAIRPAV